MATILVVDDNVLDRKYLVVLLSHHGHRLMEAADGVEGLEKTRAERPDLIISDILMPRMDGFRFAHCLRQDAATARVPVIFNSGVYRSEEVEVLAAACGVTQMLAKPEESEVVLKAVADALNASVPSGTPIDFEKEHLRLMTDKLIQEVEQLNSVTHKLEALIELGEQMDSEHDSKRLLERYCNVARDLVLAKFAAIGLMDDGGTMGFFLLSGLESRALHRSHPPQIEGILQTILTEQQPIRMRNPGGDPVTVGFPPDYPPIHSLLGIPLASAKRAYGYLCLLNKLGPEEFDKDDERIALALARQIAVGYENRRAEEQMERMGRLKRFLPPQVVEHILRTNDDRVFESHRRNVTAVFFDLRGFTSFSEKSEPEEVMEVLKGYHVALGELVSKYEGTLEHFAGDGCLVFFNDPIPCEDHTEKAVRMALELRDRVTALRSAWLKRGYDLHMGAGITVGYATLGQIGFEGRLEYAAIGNEINLAARLCGEAGGGQVLTNQKTLSEIEDLVEAEPVGELQLKGFAHPVAAFKIVGLRR